MIKVNSFSVKAICLLMIVIAGYVFTAEGTFAKAKSSGKYPTRAGTILVTPDKYKGLIPTGHAAIVKSKTKVVESLINGVCIRENNWRSKRNKIYGVTVKKTSNTQDKKAMKWCEGKVKRPYNFDYSNVWTRSKFYCSQLVWASFKDKYYIDLNTNKFLWAVHPMELVDSPKTKLIYKYSKN